MGHLTLLTGDETYKLERAVAAQRAAFIAQQGADTALLGCTRLNSPSLPQLLEALGTAPMLLFGGESLLEVTHLPALAEAPDTPEAEADLAKLKDLLPDAVASKQVLWVQPKLDKRMGFTKWLLKQPWVSHQSFEVLPFFKTDEAAMQLCHEAQQAYGVTLIQEAAHLLVDSYGLALQPLMMEVAKLATYTAGKPITPDAVRALCRLNESRFALLAGWVQQRTSPLQRQSSLEELLRHEHYLPFLALIQSYLEGQLKLKTWAGLNHSPDAIAANSGKKPFTVRKELEALARVPLGRLHSLRQQAIELEAAIKLGQLPAHTALTLLLSA
jgi:DNA polymerase III delta subunit